MKLKITLILLNIVLLLGVVFLIITMRETMISYIDLHMKKSTYILNQLSNISSMLLVLAGFIFVNSHWPKKYTNQIHMKSLTDEELEELLIKTNSFFDCPTEEDKQKLRDEYRKVEKETNLRIEESGGITQWYENGR